MLRGLTVGTRAQGGLLLGSQAGRALTIGAQAAFCVCPSADGDVAQAIVRLTVNCK